MKKVYTVFGATGEYSDHCEWPIASYLDENEAQKHVTKVTKRENELLLLAGFDGPYDYNFERDNEIAKTLKEEELDPNYGRDYTGTNYYYVETVLREECP